MGQAIEVGLSSSCMTARRVFDADTVMRLSGMNAVSRRLRALGFEMSREIVNPSDGGDPMLVLRDVSADSQQILLGMVSANTLDVPQRLRKCCLDGVRLLWADCAARGG